MMTQLHTLALYLLAVQAVLGALDTIYHHEFSEALPSRYSARLELGIHSLRACLYAPLFIGLALWHWQGWWAILLMLIFAIEIGLTLWDFVTEDQTRLLPATERVMHTVLAMNGGAIVCLLSLCASSWWQLNTALVANQLNYLHGFLIAAGLGVGLSGARDALAAFHLFHTKQESIMVTHSAWQTLGQSPRQFLITGGTGFVGQALISRLLAQGHRIIVWSRDAKKAAWLFDGKVVCVSQLNEIPASTQIDAVINLAGARILGLPWTMQRQQVLKRSRIELSARLIDFLAERQLKPQHFIQASAIGYYGIQALGDDSQLDESSPAQPIFMSELCQQWERQAARAAELGCDLYRLRFGLVLGKGGAWPMMSLPFKLGLGGKLGSGQQWYSWIHLHDLLNIIALALSQTAVPGRNQVWNCCAPGALKQIEFARVCGQVLQRPVRLPTPGWPMRLCLGQQSDLLLEGQRVYPRALLEQGFVFTYPELTGAIAQIEGKD